MELEYIPIAYDAMVFFTNAENSVTGLTQKQIQDIYVYGKYTNWNQIGGPDAELLPYRRNTDSGSHALMEQYFLEGGKLSLYLRHTQTEFFSVGKYLVLGALVSALFQTLDRSFPWGNGGDGLFLPLLVLMGMAFFLSLCSSADAVVARSFAGQFPMGALMGFMVFGPMMDIKNLILLSGGFSRKFVLRLCLTSFCICGMVVFLSFSTGLERSLL